MDTVPPPQTNKQTNKQSNVMIWAKLWQISGRIQAKSGFFVFILNILSQESTCKISCTPILPPPPEFVRKAGKKRVHKSPRGGGGGRGFQGWRGFGKNGPKCVPPKVNRHVEGPPNCQNFLTLTYYNLQ